MAGEHLLGRIDKVPAAVHELAQAEGGHKVPKRQGKGLRGRNNEPGRLGAVLADSAKI